MASKSVSEHLADHYARQVARLAAQLRECADDVERAAMGTHFRGDPAYVGAAANAVTKLHQVFANLPIAPMILAAATAQDYESTEAATAATTPGQTAEQVEA